jgi:hypothetical protein
MRRKGQRWPASSRWSGRPGDSGGSDSGEEPARRLDRLGRAADAIRGLPQQLVSGQAGIPQAAVRVQDPKLRRSTRRPKPVSRDTHLRPLSHHVTSQPDPRPTAQLQPQSRNLGQHARQGRGKARRFEDQQLYAGSTSERRQPAEPFGQARCGKPGSTQGPVRQVQQQQVHRSVLKEHGRHGHRFAERVRREDDQPLELHAPSDRLHRIETLGQVQVRDQSTSGLSLSHGPQRQCRLAAGPVAVKGSGRRTRQAAQPQDRVQRTETGWDRPLIERFDRTPGGRAKHR